MPDETPQKPATTSEPSTKRNGSKLAEQLGKVVGRTFGVLEGLALPRPRVAKPGAAAGIEHHELAKMPSSAEPVFVSCIDYAPERVQTQEIDDMEDFIIHNRPEWSQVRWINVDGLSDMSVIHALATKYDLHPLAIEDLLHIPQRPKLDSYPGRGQTHARLFIITRMMQMIHGKLHSEQVSIFLGHKTVVTFQETHGDVWDPIRQRINKPGSRMRTNDASFLVYALLDAVVDHCFPILEHYGDRLEDIEDLVLEEPSQGTIHEIHDLKRELLLLRRTLWPMREVVHLLQREPHECMSDNTRTYLRDVYDHTVQIIDIIETYREVGTGLTETYMSSMSNRMNEVMKVLTIIGTIFIPLTFLAGVYGMNMPIPENHSHWTYPAFWVICVAVAVGMITWFKRRGWL